MNPRRNWTLRIHPLLLLAVVSVADCQNLSSPKPNECEPGKYQCPGRFLCIPRRHLDSSHCVCNRFLGFRGPDCRKRSRASWLLLVLSIINALMSFRSLILNVMLALELKNSGRLKANNVGRTLFFNTLMTLPGITVATGYSLILLDVDRNADFSPYGILVCVACLFFFYFLSTLSVSMVWIVDVHRMSSLGLGRENQLAKKRQERIWLLATYVIALSSAALVMILIHVTASHTASIIGSIYNLIVAGSYHYAGRRVIRGLNVSEVNPTARHVDIAQIAENIRITSQAMTRLTLGMSVSFIGGALTLTSPDPLYPTQNSLPRICQAQVFFFMAQMCVLGVNNLIVEYMRYGSSKRQLKPEPPWTVVNVLRWLLCRSRTTPLHLSRAAVIPSVHSAAGTGGRKRGYLKERAESNGNDSSNHSKVFSTSDFTSNSGGVSSLSSEVWTQLRFNLNGLGARNPRIVKVAVEKVNGLLQPQFCSVLSSGAEPFMPMVLITLLQTKDSGAAAITGISPATISGPGVWVRGETVMDIGEGVVVNLDSDAVHFSKFEMNKLFN
mmetsp:Transcript_19542/g.33040  ORF Transcript_19542/g.33040 Transcript_19542/m.33040 type:complete len:555 (+) Transcript_19542:127-1791(+)